MGVGFNRREPSNTKRILLRPPIVEIFRRHQWLGFFELLKGYDDDLAFEFSMALNSQTKESPTTIVRVLAISLNPKIISGITTLPLGIKWSREYKATSFTAKRNFFTTNERPVEYKNGVRRKSLPYPWDEVAYHIMKYICCEGRMSVVYAYHFRLLYERRFKANFPLSQRLNVPYFLLQSIKEMSQKVREGKQQHLGCHGLIKLIVVDALNNLRIPVL